MHRTWLNILCWTLLMHKACSALGWTVPWTLLMHTTRQTWVNSCAFDAVCTLHALGWTVSLNTLVRNLHQVSNVRCQFTLSKKVAVYPLKEGGSCVRREGEEICSSWIFWLVKVVQGGAGGGKGGAGEGAVAGEGDASGQLQKQVLVQVLMQVLLERNFGYLSYYN